MYIKNEKIKIKYSRYEKDEERTLKNHNFYIETRRVRKRNDTG